MTSPAHHPDVPPADAERPDLTFPDGPKLELDTLIDDLIAHARQVKKAQGRLRGLLRAIETITSDLSLERVLRSIVEAGCELTGSRYGALGVIGSDGRLEQFIHVGIDDETAKRIGPLPKGRGLLGALIAEPRPIRLRSMGGDPRSAGFPPNHPPMESFLGVPILVRGEVFGNLYLTDSSHGEFGQDDEELALALAVAAGTAISNARLYQDAQLQRRWLEASVEIGAQLLSATGEDPLRTVARRAIDIAQADLVTLSLVSPDGEALVVEEAFGEGAADLIGRRFAVSDTHAGHVIETGRPVLLAALPEDDRRQTVNSIAVGPHMIIPLRGTGRSRGVLSLVRRLGQPAFTPRDLDMATGFASHASVALELADSRAAEQKLVLLEDRDRIAMDLHDHVIQELFAIGLSLRATATELQSEDRAARRITQRVEDIDRTIRRIRTSIFALHGNVLPSADGIRQRILEVASEVTPALGFAPHVGFSGVVDAVLSPELTDDVVACVRECLTNVAKHANARSVSVDVSLAGEVLTISVSDDGVGLGDAGRQSGARNLRARAERRGGSFELAPGASGGTMAKWRVTVT
ncbi:MAG TPA: GAF domain-containing protein [Jatrophihabitans sp.]|nr:GAF domain-containing protein [Jatrophihabitans sp.]